MTERDYLLALHRVEGLGPVTLSRLFDYFGSYQKIWWAPAKELDSLGARRLGTGLQLARDQIDPATIARELDRDGIDILTILDEAYPSLLREIHAAPTVLYLRGRLPSGPAISIVGTRRASRYGLRSAEEIATGLAASGVTVISGLAYGIDIAVHRAALRAQGATIAVLASSVDTVQPAAHREDAERILASGALISEYPPGMQTQVGFFPARNRILAGLTPATLVIEAPEKSGALITASHALAENRDVLALPGPVDTPTSAGTHALIRQGATLIRDARDVLEALGVTASASPTPPAPVSPQERSVIEVLVGPTHFDTIAERLSIPAGELGSLLTLMEVTGKIRHLGGSIYTR